MESTNFLNNIFLGFELKDLLTMSAITLSIIALILTTFDFKSKISNYIRKSKLDKLTEKDLLYLLSALYVFNKKIDRFYFFDNNNDYSKIVVNNVFLDDMKIRVHKYQSIYENSLFKNENLYRQYSEYKKIYELCHKNSDNNILNKLLYSGMYHQNMSPQMVNYLEISIEKYLLLYNEKSIHNNNILEFINI